jgi:hypothetical protein
MLRHHRRLFGSAFSLAALALIAGCTLDTAPTAGRDDTVATVDVLDPRTLLRYSEEKTAEMLDSGLPTYQMLISAATGGEIVNGPFRLSIPEDALAQDAVFTIKPTSAYEMIVQLEPTGLSFRNGKEALLTFDWSETEVVRPRGVGHKRRADARGTNGVSPGSAFHQPDSSSVEVEKVELVGMWFNPSTAKWEVVEGGWTKHGRKEYCLPLSHFSYYALAK